MSSFDAQIAVQSAAVGSPSEEALANGTPPHIELGITAGLALPIADPESGQPVVIPIGQLRFRFGREQAIEVFEAAVEAAKALPESFTPSGRVMTARSMADVEAAHQNIQRVTGR